MTGEVAAEHYLMKFEPPPSRIRVEFGSKYIADSQNVMVLGRPGT